MELKKSYFERVSSKLAKSLGGWGTNSQYIPWKPAKSTLGKGFLNLQKCSLEDYFFNAVFQIDF